ncbi:MAG: nucleotidyltransferase domain-containing protein [Candidatus Dormibacteraceae bacterium]
MNSAPAIFGSSAFPEVLNWAFEHPDREFTLGDLEAAGLPASHESLHRAMERARTAGALERRRVGRSYLYRLNQQISWLSDLRGLLFKTVGLPSRIRAALEVAIPPVEQAFLFGSVARGDDTSRSDVDLLVVGDLSQFEVARLLHDQCGELGREVNPVVIPRGELERRLHDGDPFFTEIFSGPKLWLIGDRDRPRDSDR